MAGDIKERYINPSRDITNAIETAKKEAKEEGREEGRAEGLAEGLAEGHEKGLAEGHEKGLAEGLAKGVLAVARRMKELGLPIEQISNATNLPTDQIEKL